MRRGIIFLLSILALATMCVRDNDNGYGVCLVYGDKVIGHRMGRSFAMHSVMKFPQALHVVDYLCRNGLSINDSVLVDKAVLEKDTWSPMLSDFEGERYFTYAELLEYSLAWSDNNACDLLFEFCGSPLSVEKYMRSIGFGDIRVRFTEKEMHASPGRAEENRCSPRDMARLFEWFYLHMDDNEYFECLARIMANCGTGLERVYAVKPEGSTLIHKTGSGFTTPDGRQDRNDAGIIMLPDGSHVTIAIFAPGSKTESDVADIARLYIPEGL